MIKEATTLISNCVARLLTGPIMIVLLANANTLAEILANSCNLLSARQGGITAGWTTIILAGTSKIVVLFSANEVSTILNINKADIRLSAIKI